MAEPSVDGIIADVFRLSGQKLTKDDPIIAVLIMQQQSIRQAFQEQQVETGQAMSEFLIELEKREQAITKAAGGLKEAADELKTYRKQILADLLAKTNEQLENSEERLYGGIQQKIARQTEEHIDKVVTKMNRSWLVAFVFFFLISLLVKFI